jgi:two-component system cell cycle response regulator
MGDGGVPDSVLVVDDDPATRRLIGHWLENAGIPVRATEGAKEALELLESKADSVAAIVLDVMMPEMTGYEMLEQLRAFEPTLAIPVVMLTAHAIDEPDVVRALELGATDHVSKPFSGPVLVAKVRRMIDERRRMWQLELRRKAAEADAARDALTGLYNRRHFESLFQSELAYAKRHGVPLALAILDIDHFKSLNDVFGHQEGDRVLTYFAEALRENLRGEDHAFRIGGEEFALLLRGSDAAGATLVVGRLRDAFKKTPLRLGQETDYRISFSSGVISAEPDASIEDMVRRADQALYSAKRTGRNRTVVVAAP